MQIKIMSWNLAGAKILDNLDPPNYHMTKTYIDTFKEVWRGDVDGGISNTILTAPRGEPDIILLQECIGFREHFLNPTGKWPTGKKILEKIFDGYECFFFPAFSNYTRPCPARWTKYSEIPDNVEVEQGYGICIRDKLTLRKLWVADFEHSEPDVPSEDEYHLCFEVINTMTGLYLGDRDTEPRLAVLGRIKLGNSEIDERYINFLNIHLTTLKGERVGNIRVNRLASSYRLNQIDLILDNVISAYQETTSFRVPRSTKKRQEDIWIIAGDFNAIDQSEEISLVKRVGFVDGNPDKKILDASKDRTYNNQRGTKWSIEKPQLPPIALDYILCGIERTTFPEGQAILGNPHPPYRPHFKNNRYESDHAVLYTSFEI